MPNDRLTSTPAPEQQQQTADLRDLSFEPQATRSPSADIAQQALLETGELRSNPNLIENAQREQSNAQTNHHAHHHATLAEKIAAEHAALRNAGREGPQAAQPTVIANSTYSSTRGTQPSAGNAQLHEHILSLVSTSSKKNKGVVTDDAELAEFMRQHPELSQYIQQLQEARDQALKTAQQQQNSPLQSRDNLQAKLDVIATLLEGQPIAPALRMGDVTARDALLRATQEVFQDEDEAHAISDYLNNKMRDRALFQLELDARIIGIASAELLARNENPTAEEKTAIAERIATFESRAQERFGSDPAVQAYLRGQMQNAEDMARARQVSTQAWELAVRARVQEGRVGEEACRRDLQEYLSTQEDLFARSPEFRQQLDAHLREAEREGQRIRERCDYGARQIRYACQGAGTYEHIIYEQLENRPQWEIRIIRERYQEMYDEHMRERIVDEMSGDELRRALRAYDGNGTQTTYYGTGLPPATMNRLFDTANRTEQREAILNGTNAERVAVLAHHAVAASSTPAVAVVSLLQEYRVSAPELAAAQQEIGLPSIEQELETRAAPVVTENEPTLLALRDQAGLQLVREFFSNGALTDESVARYAALEAAEYGRRLGALEARERVDAELRERLAFEHAQVQQSLAPLLARYEGLDARMAAATEDFRVRARAATMQNVVSELAEKQGLLYGDASDSVRRRRDVVSQRLETYLRSHDEFLTSHPEIRSAVDQSRESGIRRGIDCMEGVRRSVSQLNSAMAGAGTNENRAYSALQNRNPNEVYLIKQLYQERYGESVENAVEGDFSDAELDKMHALLVCDRIGVAAADAQISMSGFWGCDDAALRETLRTLKTAEDREDFKVRFDRDYAGDFYRQSTDAETPPVQAQSFEEALGFVSSGDNLIANLATFEGNTARADAALVHMEMDRFWGPDAAAAAQYVETMKQEDGHLDTERVNAAAQEYQNLYTSNLRTEAARIDAPEGRWLTSLVDGNEIDATAHKLRYSMGESLDGTEEVLLRSCLSVPEDLAARARYEERSGEVSPETQAQLNHWSEFRRQVISRYHAEGMYSDRNLVSDLRSELNDHEFRMATTLMNDGRLSLADMIEDACAGAGTDEDTLRRETEGLTKDQARELRRDFGVRGYGSLDARLRGDLSGDDEFDILANLRGLPETPEEMLAEAQRRLHHEDSGILSAFVWGGEREEMLQDYAKLQASLSGGDLYETDALYRRFGVSASAFRDQKNQVSDVVVNTGTTVILVGGTVVMVVGSGGTATPGAVAMWSLYLAGTAGAVRMGSKWAIRGEGYGIEEAGVDGGIMLIDMASVGVMSRIPVGHAVAGRLESFLGQVAAQRGAVVLAQDGTQLTGEALFRYLAQSSRSLRVVVGASQGAIDGAIFAPIQTAGISALHEETWRDGFGQGLLNIGEASLESLPAGAITGAGFGGAMSFRTPAFIKNGRPLSNEQAARVRSAGGINEEGLNLLAEREAAKGFVTRGDVADAQLAGQMLSRTESQQLVARLRENPSFSEGDIRLLENRINRDGGISRLDQVRITGESPNQYVTALSQRQLEKRVVAAQRDVNSLELQLRAPDVTTAQREALQETLRSANDRLSALQETMRGVQAARPAPELAPASQPTAARAEPSEAGPVRQTEQTPKQEAPQVTEAAPQTNERVRGLEESIARNEQVLKDGRYSNGETIGADDIGMIRENIELARGELAKLRDGVPVSEARSPQAAEAPGSSPVESELGREFAAQRELVSRLETDLSSQPQNSKIRSVIEDSLTQHRQRLQDLEVQMRAQAEAPLESSPAPRSSDASENPWAYDPSESFAAELQARARGDLDEPLGGGWNSGGDSPRRPNDRQPSGTSSSSYSTEAAPQQTRTRTGIGTEPGAESFRTAAHRTDADGAQMRLDEPEMGIAVLDEPVVVPSRAAPQQESGVRLSDAEEALVREMLDSVAPAAQPQPLRGPAQEQGVRLSDTDEAVVRQMLEEAAVTTKPAPAVRPAPVEIPAPLRQPAPAPLPDEALVRPAALPEIDPRAATTPGLMLGRIVSPSSRAMTNESDQTNLYRDPAPTRPHAETAPKTHTETHTRHRQHLQNGGGEGGDSEPKDIAARRAELDRIEAERKHHEEEQKLIRLGGGKLKFVKISDALGEETLMVENEEKLGGEVAEG